MIPDGRGRVAMARHKGQLHLPGGGLDADETHELALLREVREETCLDVEVGAVVEVLDRISRDSSGRVEYHYVIVDYCCHLVDGTPPEVHDFFRMVESEARAAAGVAGIG